MEKGLKSNLFILTGEHVGTELVLVKIARVGVVLRKAKWLD